MTGFLGRPTTLPILQRKICKVTTYIVSIHCVISIPVSRTRSSVIATWNSCVDGNTRYVKTRTSVFQRTARQLRVSRKTTQEFHKFLKQLRKGSLFGDNVEKEVGRCWERWPCGRIISLRFKRSFYFGGLTNRIFRLCILWKLGICVTGFIYEVVVKNLWNCRSYIGSIWMRQFRLYIIVYSIKNYFKLWTLILIWLGTTFIFNILSINIIKYCSVILSLPSFIH